MIELSETAAAVGEIRIATKGDELVGLAFVDSWARIERHLSRWFPCDELRAVESSHQVAERLEAYLGGELEALAGIPLNTAGTAFQRSVWAALLDIPAGETETYAELALAAENPRAVRAAGTACGANPIWLFIPCHRAIRATGELGNYGGGIERKRWLLDHERHNSPAAGIE